MSIRIKLIAALCGLLSSTSIIAQEQSTVSKRFTAERVFDLEYASDPRISPNGQTIAYVRHSMDIMTDRDTGRIWLYDLKSKSHLPLLEGSASSFAPRWSPDGTRLLYGTVSNGKPTLKVYYSNSDKSVPLAQFTKAPSSASWSPDGTQIAFSMFVDAKKPSFAVPLTPPEGASWNPGVKVFDDLTFRFDGAGYLKEGANQIFVLPVSSGTPRQLTFGDASMSSPTWLNNNTVLATGNRSEGADLDPIESEIYAIKLNDLSISAYTDRDGPDRSPAVSPSGKYIAYLGYDDKVLSYQQNDVYLMNADGTEARELAADFAGSIGQIAWSEDSKTIFFSSEDYGVISLYKMNLSGKVTKLLTDVGGTSIGRPYAAGSFSLSKESRPTIAYTAGFAEKPAELAVANYKGNDQQVLTGLNDDVLPFLDIANVEEVKVKSRYDGKEIEAWVAFPPDFKADGSFPMILEIHGGPYTMYGPYFAAEIQRFAAEGYVTVWSNPRGSTGYGEAFALSIDKAYPGNDYEDLMTVVDEVVARKYVDPDRLFVTGGSGGGILTAWIVTQTDRFAAAASIKPVINWMTMALAADIAQFVRRHWIREDPWSNPQAYLERSPISYIDKITTPTMVMVGEQDYRTPPWEAEQFYTALKMQGVDTALIYVPEAPHYIASRPSRLVAKTDNIMGWFKKYDKAEVAKEE